MGILAGFVGGILVAWGLALGCLALIAGEQSPEFTFVLGMVFGAICGPLGATLGDEWTR